MSKKKTDWLYIIFCICIVLKIIGVVTLGIIATYFWYYGDSSYIEKFNRINHY